MHRRSSGVQGLVFGGIMAGLVLLFALVPFLAVLVPIPLVVVYVRYGGRTATLTAIVATALAMMFQGPMQTLFLTMPAGILPGLAFGYGFRHKLKPLIIGLVAAVTFFGAYVVDYVATRAAFMGGQDPIAQMFEVPQMRETWNKMLEPYRTSIENQAATTDAQKAAKEKALMQVREYQENPAGFAQVLLPSILFMSSIVSAFINYSLCAFTLRRFGHEVPPRAPFSQFRLPMWMVWVFVAAFGATYFINMNGTLMNAPWWAKAFMNVMTPLNMVFALGGLAAIYGYLRIKMKMTKLAAVALSLAPGLLFGMNAPLIYSMLAVWDTIFDFRGLGHGVWKRPDPNPWEE